MSHSNYSFKDRFMPNVYEYQINPSRPVPINKMDPLLTRSYVSSGGPTLPEIMDFPTTFGNLSQLTPQQLEILKKETQLHPLETRSLHTNVKEIEKEYYCNTPIKTNRGEVFSLIPFDGTNISTRIAGLNEATNLQQTTRNQFNSYGSYDMIRT